MSSSQGMRMICKNSMVRENKYMQVYTPFSPSINQVKKYTKEAETSAIGKGPEEGLKNVTMSSSQRMGSIRKKFMVLDKAYIQVHNPCPPSTNRVKQCTKEVEKSIFKNNVGSN